MRPTCRRGRITLRTFALGCGWLCALAAALLIPSVAFAAGPTISTTASDATIGDPIHDDATVTDALFPTTGTVTFSLYGPGDPTCIGASVFTADVTAGTDGTASSPDYTPTVAGAYRWIASYRDDALNGDASGGCGDPGETSTVAKATPTLTTAATGATVGGQIHDDATVAGGYGSGGTVTFRLYASSDPDCTGSELASDTVTLSGGTAQSPDFTTASAGDYHWVATYDGNANNEAVNGACGDAGETSTVAKATPTLTTSASDATIGGSIHDTATISGGFTPGGTVTFHAYGPGDATCTTSVFDSGPIAVVSGSAVSADFTPATAGTYRWKATYSGDDDNAPLSGACGAADETSTVAKATPTLTTSATDATIGGPIHDTATISGGHDPGGTVTFRLFAPGDVNCTGTPVLTSTPGVNVSGNGIYGSGDTTPGAAGTYRWTATYSGDGNNEAVGGACNDPGETSTISKFAPAITTTATDATIGGTIHDDASLAGGSAAPGGTITFRAYGPDDATCTGTAAYTSSDAPDPGGLAGSGNFQPTMPGAYRWTVEYSGDARNSPASGACGAPGETSIVKASPAVTSVATDATIGDEIHDSARLSGGHDPGGSITFLAFGPDGSGCAGSAVYNSGPVPVVDGSASSGDFSPPSSGTYRWRVSYSGDAGNVAVAPSCAADASTVSVAAPTLSAVASDTVIGGQIHDTATLAGGYRPNGTITFRAYGPGSSSCTGTVAFNSGPIPVSGNGAYGSGDFSPPTSGSYRWTASYSGDAENAASATTCNAKNGTSAVALSDVRAADQDNDGTPDSIDDCPLVPGGGKSRGCREIERGLSIAYRHGTFRGTMAPPDACGADQKVSLLVKRRARTSKVASTRTSESGRFSIRAHRLNGSYYVRSLSSLEPAVGICVATQSKRILPK